MTKKQEKVGYFDNEVLKMLNLGENKKVITQLAITGALISYISEVLYNEKNEEGRRFRNEIPNWKRLFKKASKEASIFPGNSPEDASFSINNGQLCISGRILGLHTEVTIPRDIEHSSEIKVYVEID